LTNPVVEEVALPSPKAPCSKEPWSKAKPQLPRKSSRKQWRGDRPKEWHKERPKEWQRDYPSKEGKRETYAEVVEKGGKGSAPTKSSPTRCPPRGFAKAPQSTSPRSRDQHKVECFSYRGLRKEFLHDFRTCPEWLKNHPESVKGRLRNSESQATVGLVKDWANLRSTIIKNVRNGWLNTPHIQIGGQGAVRRAASAKQEVPKTLGGKK